MTLLIVIVVMTIFAGFSTILSAGDIVEKKSSGLTIKGYWLTGKGYLLVITNVCIIGFAILQNIVTENEQIRKDKILREQYNSSLRANSKEIVGTITATLAEYGLKVDADNKNLVKLIRDSAKNKTIIGNADPVFGFCLEKPISINNDNKKQIDISIESRDAGSTGFNYKIYAVFQDSLNKFYYDGSKLENQLNEDNLPMNKCLVTGYILEPNNYINIYILIRGTYQDLSKTKSYNVNDMAGYSFKNNVSFLPNNYLKRRVIEAISANVKL